MFFAFLCGLLVWIWAARLAAIRSSNKDRLKDDKQVLKDGKKDLKDSNDDLNHSKNGLADSKEDLNSQDSNLADCQHSLKPKNSNQDLVEGEQSCIAKQNLNASTAILDIHNANPIKEDSIIKDSILTANSVKKVVQLIEQNNNKKLSGSLGLIKDSAKLPKIQSEIGLKAHVHILNDYVNNKKDNGKTHIAAPSAEKTNTASTEQIILKTNTAPTDSLKIPKILSPSNTNESDLSTYIDDIELRFANKAHISASAPREMTQKSTIKVQDIELKFKRIVQKHQITQQQINKELLSVIEKPETKAAQSVTPGSPLKESQILYQAPVKTAAMKEGEAESIQRTNTLPKNTAPVLGFEHNNSLNGSDVSSTIFNSSVTSRVSENPVFSLEMMHRHSLDFSPFSHGKHHHVWDTSRKSESESKRPLSFAKNVKRRSSSFTLGLKKSFNALDKLAGLLRKSSDSKLNDNIQPAFATKPNNSRRYFRSEILNKAAQELTSFPVVDKRCISLSLEKNEIRRFPKDLVNLENIQSLNLAANLLEDIPSDIDMLSNLQEFDLSQNFLIFLPPSFRFLKKLKSLYLSHNQLAKLDMNLFSLMDSMENLDLSFNLLTQIPSSLGLRKQSLKSLKIVGNPLPWSLSNLMAPTPTIFSRKSKTLDSNEIGPNCDHLYLQRLLGYLRDQHTLEERYESKLSHSWLFDVCTEIDVIEYAYEPIYYQEGVEYSDVCKSIIRELYETEVTYVKELQTVYDLYHQPISALGIDKILVKSIFSNLDLLLTFHRDHVVKDLENVFGMTNSSIGNLFLAISEKLLEAYQEYVINYSVSASLIKFIAETIPTSSKVLFTYPEKPKISNTLHAYSLVIQAHELRKLKYLFHQTKNDPRHTQLDLTTYLMIPFQRIPRYAMLLNNLAKRIDTEHEDFPTITRASKNIATIVEEMNVSKGRWEAAFNESDQILSNVKYLSFSCNANFALNTPIQRFLIDFGQDPEWCLLKHVKLEHEIDELDFTLITKKLKVTRICKLEETTFKPQREDAEKYSKDIEKGGAFAIYSVSRIEGKNVCLALFNDMILLLTQNLELMTVMPLGYGTWKGRHAETCPLTTGSELGVMRVTDGKSILYIKGRMSNVVQWEKYINMI